MPIFNEPAFDIKLDKVGLYRALEMIALPKTVFQVLEVCGDFARVLTDEYVVPYPIYAPLDRLEMTTRKCRVRQMPPKKKILERLVERLGTPYLWGGNVAHGICKADKIHPMECRLYSLAGLDCSGLLYEATDGCVPRNTGHLRQMGREVTDVKPLDIGLLPGHVFIVIEGDEVIESRHEWGGVVKHRLKDRLALEPYLKVMFRRLF